MGVFAALAVAAGALLLAAPNEEVEEPKVCKIGIGNRVLYPPGVLQGSEYVQAYIQGKNKNNENIQVTGYVKKSDFDALNVSTVDIPENFAGLEAVCVPTRLENQLFRIYEVFEDEDCVTVKARHVWYDNLQNYTLWQPTEGTEYTGAAACRNILTNALSETASLVASDCTDTKTFKATDFERKNLVEAYLDPENGICAKYGLSLIRDNWDFFCLKEVGYDRGFVVQNKKNLLGVERTESIENVATRIAPYGKDANGDIVWLDNDGVKYVDSQYITDYGYPRVEILDTGLQIGKDEVTADNINDKLLVAAEKRFTEDKVDLPELEMKIEFLSLGDTEEYAQYRGLDKVYLYDIITIKDTVRGYEYSAQVVGIEHDILTGTLLSVTLGSIQNSDGIRKIAVWQVPEINGENIRLKTILSGSFAEGAINSLDIADGAVSTIHLASATIDDLEAINITAVTARIHEIIAGSITADDIQTGSLTADVIAAGAITAAKIAAEAITTEKLAANAITAAKIAASAITTDKLDAYAVTAQKIASEAITTDKLAANAVTADKISASDLSAINAKLGTAQIAIAEIGNADISYAKIKDLTAGTAIFDTSITQQGIADRLYINRLLITYGQMVEATIGDLVIGASDGNYYHVDVSWSASGVPTLVPTQVTTPSAAEIAAGHTSSGKTIIGDVGTYAELCSSDFYAINSIIDVITAKRIDVDELWAREAFINKLMVTDISSNTYIQSTIGNWQSGSTITQTIAGISSRVSSLGYGTIYYSATEPDHAGLVQGDIWVQPLDNHIWNEYESTMWQEILANGTWEDVRGSYKCYVWTGQLWNLLFDNTVNVEMWTAIEQNAAAIQLKANQTEVNTLSGEVSEFAATLEVQAQEISSAVSAVNSKASTYLMWADPRTAYTVTLGDIWIKCQENFGRWLETKSSTWQFLKNTYDWADSLGSETYVWNGQKWIQTADRATEVYQQTLIDQTSTQISLVAETTAVIGDEIIRMNSSITQTAERITQEVARATNAENGKIEKTTQFQTADMIYSEAVRQSGVNAQGSYIAKTISYQTADEIVDEAIRESVDEAGNHYLAKTSRYQTADAIVTEAVSQASTSASNNYLRKTTTYQSADQIYSEAVRQSGANAATQYIAKTGVYQTADSIRLAAIEESESYTDENCYKIQSGIEIKAAGIEISGAKYIKIKSGGSFTVDSGKFSIDTGGNVVMQGTVRATAGYINSWTINGDYIWSGTGANTVALDSSTSRNFAIYAGADYGDQAAWQAAGSPSGKTYDAPFRVKRDGTVYITKLKAQNQQGQYVDVNLFTVGLWKLGGQTIDGSSIQTSGGYCTSFKLYGGTTINFKSAASVTMSGSWSGNTYTVTNSGNDRTVSTTLSATTGTGAIPSYGTTVSTFNSSHKTGVIIASETGPIGNLGFTIDATSEYNAGYGSAKIAASWNGNTVTLTKSTSGTDSRAFVITAVADISYNSTTHKYTASASARANGTSRDTDSEEGGTEAYQAGIDSVYVSGAERQSGNTFSTNKKTVYFNVRGLASNGSVGSWTQVSADVSTSYNAGYDDGYSAGWAACYDAIYREDNVIYGPGRTADSQVSAWYTVTVGMDSEYTWNNPAAYYIGCSAGASAYINSTYVAHATRYESHKFNKDGGIT